MKALYMFRWEGDPHPSKAEIAAEMGIGESDLDDTFGVIAIDPDDRMYSALMEPSSVSAFLKENKKSRLTNLQGPFSNTRIDI